MTSPSCRSHPYCNATQGLNQSQATTLYINYFNEVGVEVEMERLEAYIGNTFDDGLELVCHGCPPNKDDAAALRRTVKDLIESLTTPLGSTCGRGPFFAVREVIPDAPSRKRKADPGPTTVTVLFDTRDEISNTAYDEHQCQTTVDNKPSPSTARKRHEYKHVSKLAEEAMQQWLDKEKSLTLPSGAIVEIKNVRVGRAAAPLSASLTQLLDYIMEYHHRDRQCLLLCIKHLLVHYPGIRWDLGKYESSVDEGKVLSILMDSMFAGYLKNPLEAELAKRVGSGIAGADDPTPCVALDRVNKQGVLLAKTLTPTRRRDHPKSVSGLSGQTLQSRSVSSGRTTNGSGQFSENFGLSDRQWMRWATQVLEEKRTCLEAILLYYRPGADGVSSPAGRKKLIACLREPALGPLTPHLYNIRQRVVGPDKEDYARHQDRCASHNNFLLSILVIDTIEIQPHCWRQSSQKWKDTLATVITDLNLVPAISEGSNPGLGPPLYLLAAAALKTIHGNTATIEDLNAAWIKTIDACDSWVLAAEELFKLFLMNADVKSPNAFLAQEDATSDFGVVTALKDRVVQLLHFLVGQIAVYWSSELKSKQDDEMEGALFDIVVKSYSAMSDVEAGVFFKSFASSVFTKRICDQAPGSVGSGIVSIIHWAETQSTGTPRRLGPFVGFMAKLAFRADHVAVDAVCDFLFPTWQWCLEYVQTLSTVQCYARNLRQIEAFSKTADLDVSRSSNSVDAVVETSVRIIDLIGAVYGSSECAVRLESEINKITGSPFSRPLMSAVMKLLQRQRQWCSVEPELVKSIAPSCIRCFTRDAGVASTLTTILTPLDGVSGGVAKMRAFEVLLEVVRHPKILTDVETTKAFLGLVKRLIAKQIWLLAASSCMDNGDEENVKEECIIAVRAMMKHVYRLLATDEFYEKGADSERLAIMMELVRDVSSPSDDLTSESKFMCELRSETLQWIHSMDCCRVVLRVIASESSEVDQLYRNRKHSSARNRVRVVEAAFSLVNNALKESSAYGNTALKQLLLAEPSPPVDGATSMIAVVASYIGHAREEGPDAQLPVLATNLLSRICKFAGSKSIVGCLKSAFDDDDGPSTEYGKLQALFAHRLRTASRPDLRVAIFECVSEAIGASAQQPGLAQLFLHIVQHEETENSNSFKLGKNSCLAEVINILAGMKESLFNEAPDVIAAATKVVLGFRKDYPSGLLGEEGDFWSHCAKPLFYACDAEPIVGDKSAAKRWHNQIMAQANCLDLLTHEAFSSRSTVAEIGPGAAVLLTDIEKKKAAVAEKKRKSAAAAEAQIERFCSMGWKWSFTECMLTKPHAVAQLRLLQAWRSFITVVGANFRGKLTMPSSELPKLIILVANAFQHQSRHLVTIMDGSAENENSENYDVRVDELFDIVCELGELFLILMQRLSEATNSLFDSDFELLGHITLALECWCNSTSLATNTAPIRELLYAILGHYFRRCEESSECMTAARLIFPNVWNALLLDLTMFKEVGTTKEKDKVLDDGGSNSMVQALSLLELLVPRLWIRGDHPEHFFPDPLVFETLNRTGGLEFLLQIIGQSIRKRSDVELVSRTLSLILALSVGHGGTGDEGNRNIRALVFGRSLPGQSNGLAFHLIKAVNDLWPSSGSSGTISVSSIGEFRLHHSSSGPPMPPGAYTDADERDSWHEVWCVILKIMAAVLRGLGHSECFLEDTASFIAASHDRLLLVLALPTAHGSYQFTRGHLDELTAITGLLSEASIFPAFLQRFPRFLADDGLLRQLLRLFRRGVEHLEVTNDFDLEVALRKHFRAVSSSERDELKSNLKRLYTRIDGRLMTIVRDALVVFRHASLPHRLGLMSTRRLFNPTFPLKADIALLTAEEPGLGVLRCCIESCCKRIAKQPELSVSDTDEFTYSSQHLWYTLDSAMTVLIGQAAFLQHNPNTPDFANRQPAGLFSPEDYGIELKQGLQKCWDEFGKARMLGRSPPGSPAMGGHPPSTSRLSLNRSRSRSRSPAPLNRHRSPRSSPGLVTPSLKFAVEGTVDWAGDAVEEILQNFCTYLHK